MKLTYISEQDCILDIDPDLWYKILENRGGCRCIISPPCSACCTPVEESELIEYGYAFYENTENPRGK